MAYNVKVDKAVIKVLDQIDDYCISHFGNYNFGKKVYLEIVKVHDVIKENPKLYKEIKRNHHKVSLINVGYNLYYKIDDTSKCIVIYALKSYKQNQ